MDVSVISGLIGSLGFPIVACCYMAWSNEKESRRHEAETRSTIEAINNNTLALTKLAERLEVRTNSENP